MPGTVPTQSTSYPLLEYLLTAEDSIAKRESSTHTVLWEIHGSLEMQLSQVSQEGLNHNPTFPYHTFFLSFFPIDTFSKNFFCLIH